MRKFSASIVLGSLGCLLLVASFSLGQDFKRDYSLVGNGHVRIGNISGDVRISGYGGTTIIVAGFKEGRDRDRIQIEDNSTADTIDIRVRYPESGNCNASASFEVKVPQSIEYIFDRIRSISGNVEITNVKGKIKADSVSGNVDVRDVAGIVSATTVSGSVNVEIARIEGAGDMKFSSVSGNVNVKAPLNLNADIEMSSISGSLRTDFPIEIQEQRYGPGRSAHGRLGSGSFSMRITTVSGRVSLTKM